MKRDGNRIRMGIVLLTIGFLGLLVSLTLFTTWGYTMWGFGMTDSVGGRWGGWQGPLTMNNAIKIAESYLESLGNTDLAIDEIMEFELNFYIVYYEKSTGIGAFEMIIDKPGTGGMMRMMGNGYIRPEQGPNMMWNTKYGMHGVMGT